MMEIQNLPAYAAEYKYIVARWADGGLWFWGAYDDENSAKAAACEIGGVVVERE